jgi:hypothetical protein
LKFLLFLIKKYINIAKIPIIFSLYPNKIFEYIKHANS